MPASHNLFGFTPKLLASLLFPIAGYSIGAYLDHLETLRMTSFRDKSALYGKPPEKRTAPSWPVF